jgi:hypothetical protein
LVVVVVIAGFTPATSNSISPLTPKRAELRSSAFGMRLA